jgi:hypothetical protein
MGEGEDETAGAGDGVCSTGTVVVTFGISALLDVQALIAVQHTAMRVNLEIRLNFIFIEHTAFWPDS